MAEVRTPVKGFTGTVAGVHFREGAGETEDPAALAYFERQGYLIVAPDAAPSDDQHERDDDGTPPAPAEGDPAAEEGAAGPKRPYPQANKGEWFEYLSQINPGHGLTIEDATKRELIEAADAAEASRE